MRSKSLLLATLILAGAVAGCTSIGPQPTPVAPTKTPKPTFTATPDWTPTPVAFATAAPVAAEPTAEAAAPAQPEATADPAATEAPTDEAPAAEPPAAGANQVARADGEPDGQCSRRTGHQLSGDRPPERRASLSCHRQKRTWRLVSVRLGWQVGLGDRQPGQRQRRSGCRAGGAEYPSGAHSAPDGAAAAATDVTAGCTAASATEHTRIRHHPGPAGRGATARLSPPRPGGRYNPDKNRPLRHRYRGRCGLGTADLRARSVRRSRITGSTARKARAAVCRMNPGSGSLIRWTVRPISRTGCPSLASIWRWSMTASPCWA